MQVASVTAEVLEGDGRDYAHVVLTLTGGEQVEFQIGASVVHPDTINVEVDGDLTSDDPSLRIHLNDQLIADTAFDDAAVTDQRRPGPSLR